MEKELIATQLVVGCCNVDTKKQLLQRAQVDLDAFVALVHAVETAEWNLSALQMAGLSSVKVISKGGFQSHSSMEKGKRYD